MITRFVPGYATNQLRRLAWLNHPVEPLSRGHTRSRTDRKPTQGVRLGSTDRPPRCHAGRRRHPAHAELDRPGSVQPRFVQRGCYGCRRDRRRARDQRTGCPQRLDNGTLPVAGPAGPGMCRGKWSRRPRPGSRPERGSDAARPAAGPTTSTAATRVELETQRDRALALGATQLLDRTDDEHEPMYVFADPAGHPFCVFVSDE